MEWLLLRTDTPTISGRIYPKDVVMKVINDPEFIKRLESGQITGQIGFPPTWWKNDLTLESHVIKKVYLKDNDLYGEVEILNNRNGENLKKLLASDGITFALRGIGDVDRNEDGINVVSNLTISSFDAVYKSNKE